MFVDQFCREGSLSAAVDDVGGATEPSAAKNSRGTANRRRKTPIEFNVGIPGATTRSSLF